MSVPDLLGVDGAAWDEARRCFPVIRRLAEDGARTRAKILAAARELGCGPTHVYALLRRYADVRRLTSLLPRMRGRRVGHNRLDPAVEAVIEVAIDEFYLTRQRPRIVALVSEVRRRCTAGGLPLPSRTAIAARVKDRKAREVAWLIARLRPDDLEAKLALVRTLAAPEEAVVRFSLLGEAARLSPNDQSVRRGLMEVAEFLGLK